MTAMSYDDAKNKGKGPKGNGEDDGPSFSVVDRRPVFGEDEAEDAVAAGTGADPSAVAELQARVDEA